MKKTNNKWPKYWVWSNIVDYISDLAPIMNPDLTKYVAWLAVEWLELQGLMEFDVRDKKICEHPGRLTSSGMKTIRASGFCDYCGEEL